MVQPPIALTVVMAEHGDAIRNFLRYLTNALGTSAQVPVSEILRRVPFGNIEADTRDALVRRGNLVPKGENGRDYGSITNRGSEIYAEFMDAQLGKVAINVPESVTAHFRVSEQTLSLQFPEPIDISIFGLPKLTGDLARPAEQSLSAVSATPLAWTYRMNSRRNPAETLDLVISFPVGMEVHQATSQVEGSAARSGLDGLGVGWRKSSTVGARRFDCPFKGRGRLSADDIIKRYTGPVDLHIRSLVPPTRHSVDEYVEGIRIALAESGVPSGQLLIRVASQESVVLPQYAKLDAGDAGGAESDAVAGLFDYNPVPAWDPVSKSHHYVMYIVESISRGSNRLFGVHRMPGNVFAIAADSPLYQAAHEFGHNLGMDDDSTSPNAVMNNNVVDSGFPVYTEQQVNQYIRVVKS